MKINYKKILTNMVSNYECNNGTEDTICWLYCGDTTPNEIAAIMNLRVVDVMNALEVNDLL